MATAIPLAAPGGLASVMGNSGATNFTLDSAGASEDAVALCFTAPKTGSIDAVGFRINSVVGTGSVVKVSVQGQSAGAPDGTPISTEMTVSGVGSAPYTAASFNWVTLTPTPASVTGGSEYAAVIRLTTASTSVTITTGLDGVVSGALAGSPSVRTQTNLTGWAATDDSMPAIAVRYSDGDIIYGTIPYVSSLSSNTFASDTTAGSGGDERGVYWTTEAAVTVLGAEIAFRADNANSTWDVCCYVDNGAASFSRSFVANDLRAINSMGRLAVHFDTPVSVPAGSKCRITVKPTTAAATGTVRVIEWTFPDSDSREAVVGRLARCDRADAGAWNDSTTQFIQITPVLAEITTGGGLAGRIISPGGIAG